MNNPLIRRFITFDSWNSKFLKKKMHITAVKKLAIIPATPIPIYHGYTLHVYLLLAIWE